MIPYSCQDINEADEREVLRVLRSDFLTQGEEVPAFEQALAERADAREVIAVNSGTSALHLACLALGLSSGDIVWTSPISFTASANCALYCGATVDFVDIDSETGNLSPTVLAAKLAEAEASGCLPKIIIPVHFAGQSCDMDSIARLARQYGVKVIEDASHALGADYKDRPVGGCRYSDVTVFSFHPVKMITTGEGGALTTNDAALAERARALRTHGITRDPIQIPELKSEPWRYEQRELGFNYRMTDIEAALGRSQLARLDAFLETRRRLAQRYLAAFRDSPVTTLSQSPDGESSWHLMSIQVPADARAELFHRLRSDGIGVNVHYIPIYLQPFYREAGFTAGYCDAAERFYAGALSIPLQTRLSDDQQSWIVSRILQHLGA